MPNNWNDDSENPLANNHSSEDRIIKGLFLSDNMLQGIISSQEIYIDGSNESPATETESDQEIDKQD